MSQAASVFRLSYLQCGIIVKRSDADAPGLALRLCENGEKPRLWSGRFPQCLYPNTPRCNFHLSSSWHHFRNLPSCEDTRLGFEPTLHEKWAYTLFSVCSVPLWFIIAQKKQPQRHRAHRGCTEKKPNRDVQSHSNHHRLRSGCACSRTCCYVELLVA